MERMNPQQEKYFYRGFLFGIVVANIFIWLIIKLEE